MHIGKAIYLFMKFDTMVLGSSPDTLASEAKKTTQSNKRIRKIKTLLRLIFKRANGV